MNDLIRAFTRRSVIGTPEGHEYDRWLNQEPAWQAVDNGDAIQ